MSSNFYNYVYLDPRKPGKYPYKDICLLYEPYYVGKGTGLRYLQHLREKPARTNKILKDKIIYLSKEYNLSDYIDVFNYTLDENLSYEREDTLIKEIGSNYIDEIKNGPLVNLNLGSNPPNHKGKTYVEIYGSVERAQEQIELRRKIQIERGGFFGGHIHTEESKQKISRSSIRENNGMWGKNHTEEAKKIVAEKAMKRTEEYGNPNSKTHLIISPDGKEYITRELKKFCNNMGISYMSLKKTFLTGQSTSRGKTIGWILKSSI